jgi:uncharacterized membrane protein
MRCLVLALVLVVLLIAVIAMATYIYKKVLDLTRDSSKLDQYSIVQYLIRVFASALLLLIVMLLLLLVAVLMYTLFDLLLRCHYV